jgi:hypothetical protein
VLAVVEIAAMRAHAPRAAPGPGAGLEYRDRGRARRA